MISDTAYLTGKRHSLENPEYPVLGLAFGYQPLKFRILIERRAFGVLIGSHQEIRQFGVTEYLGRRGFKEARGIREIDVQSQ